MIFIPFIACVHVRHLLFLLVLFIHGSHPHIKRSSINFSTDDIFISMDEILHPWIKSCHPWMEFLFVMFWGENWKKKYFTQSHLYQNSHIEIHDKKIIHHFFPWMTLSSMDEIFPSMDDFDI